MSAAENLQPRQFFHGTTADLREGDVVYPGIKVGRGRGRSVWMTPSAEAARSWAGAKAPKEADPADPTGYGTRPAVPTHVYEVEPEAPNQDRNGHWKATAARVKRRVS